MAAIIQPFIAFVLGSINNIPILQTISENFGVPPSVVVSVVGLGLLSLVFSAAGGAAMAHLIGFVYPAYLSFKALRRDPEAPLEENELNNAQWLTYWVVFAFLSTAENVLSSVFALIPFYSLLKIVLLIWLFHPSTLGATVIFTTIIEPAIAPHEEAIDEHLDGLGLRRDVPEKAAAAAVAAEAK